MCYVNVTISSTKIPESTRERDRQRALERLGQRERNLELCVQKEKTPHPTGLESIRNERQRGLIGLQVPNGTVGSAKEESPSISSWRCLGWHYSGQNHSRLSHGVRVCAWNHGNSEVVANLELSPQACGTRYLSPHSSLSCGFSDFTKALSP